MCAGAATSQSFCDLALSQRRQMQTLVDAYCDAFTDLSASCNSSRSFKPILK